MPFLLDFLAANKEYRGEKLLLDKAFIAVFYRALLQKRREVNGVMRIEHINERVLFLRGGEELLHRRHIGKQRENGKYEIYQEHVSRSEQEQTEHSVYYAC